MVLALQDKLGIWQTKHWWWSKTFFGDYLYGVFCKMENAYVLETRALSHSFADGATVLNQINLQVPAGSVYGFLGPNGAGKTTTLRLVLGLLKKQQGEIRIFGKPFDQHRISTLQKIGAMIESPSLYGHLTATENLRVLQKVYQCPPERINVVLNMVGLAATGSKKAARFSLGMKQRLSIAMALLHEPGLLILDEPTNGLDPNGMIEVRELLLALNRRHGITVIISSHLLAEIEKMVSHVGIIHKGNLLFQGTLAELQKQRVSGATLSLSTGDNEKAIEILRNRGIDVEISDHLINLPTPELETVASIVREFVAAGIDIYQLSPAQNNLEAIFMEMITN